MFAAYIAELLRIDEAPTKTCGTPVENRFGKVKGSAGDMKFRNFLPFRRFRNDTILQQANQ